MQSSKAHKAIVDAAKKLLSESTNNQQTSVDHPMIEHASGLRHRLNSQGLPIHTTDDGIRAFYDWFGSSKAVDEHGRPKVVYHGTTKDFDSFSRDKVSTGYNRYGPGFYFTDHKKTFDVYSGSEGGHVMPVYLKLETPSESDELSKDQITNFFGALTDKVFPNGFNATQIHNHIKKTAEEKPDNAMSALVSNQGCYISHNDWYKGIKAAGIDGFKRNVFSDETEYVVHSPNQIKSAIGNTGEFSAAKNKITESR